jgi:hypothetical protein
VGLFCLSLQALRNVAFRRLGTCAQLSSIETRNWIDCFTGLRQELQDYSSGSSATAAAPREEGRGFLGAAT